MSARFECAAVALLLLVALVLSVSSMRSINETTDEVPHIAAGYSYLLKADYRLNVEHPPLAKEIAALPLLILSPRFDERDWQWKRSLAWDVGKKFLYKWNKPEQIVFWSRLPIVGLYLGLGLLVWRAARTLYGAAAGLLALIFALFTPELIAHGQLVTTDLPLTLFGFAAAWCCYRALLFGQSRDIALCAFACGAVAVTKFTAPVIFVGLLLVVFIYVVVGARLHDVAGTPPLKGRCRRSAVLIGCALGTTVLTIWAVYGFRYAISPEVEILVPWHEFDPNRIVTRYVLFLREWRLLPEAYLAGILECFKMLPDRPSYLMGEVLAGGRWFYFPVTFLLKTPIPLLLLLVCGVMARRKNEWLSPSNLMLLFLPLLYFGVAMASEVNIGNRHILPVYPFLIVWAAGSAGPYLAGGDREDQNDNLVRPTHSVRRAGWNWRFCSVAGLVIWLLVGTIRIYPNYLSYFNEIAGGPAGGTRYLADSNNDWGQNLVGLAEYAREHAVKQLYLCYSGSADPAYYLPTATVLPCLLGSSGSMVPIPSGTLVAISQNALVGSFLRNQPDVMRLVDRLRQLTPIDRIGYSILIYRMP